MPHQGWPPKFPYYHQDWLVLEALPNLLHWNQLLEFFGVRGQVVDQYQDRFTNDLPTRLHDQFQDRTGYPNPRHQDEPRVVDRFQAHTGYPVPILRVSSPIFLAEPEIPPLHEVPSILEALAYSGPGAVASDGRCGQRSVLDQLDLRCFHYNGQDFSLDNDVNIRTDTSKSTLEFIAAFTKMILERQAEYLNSGAATSDETSAERLQEFSRVHNLFTNCPMEELTQPTLTQRFYVDEMFLHGVGLQFDVGVEILAMSYDEGEHIRVPIHSVGDNKRVIEITSKVDTSGKPIHFDLELQFKVSSRLLVQSFKVLSTHFISQHQRNSWQQ